MEERERKATMKTKEAFSFLFFGKGPRPPSSFMDFFSPSFSSRHPLLRNPHLRTQFLVGLDSRMGR